MSSFLSLSGSSGNNASTPDAAALDVVGDIDIRAKAALDDWSPAVEPAFVGKFGAIGFRSYELNQRVNDKLRMQWSEDGSAALNKFSTVVTGITDGETKWVRGTLDVDNGASGHDVEFFLSDDGSDWSQLGTTITTAGVTSIFASTQLVRVGADSAGNSKKLVGKVYRALILDGIDGTVVFDAHFDDPVPGTTSFTENSSEAATVTINQSGDPQAEIIETVPSYLSLPGESGDYASTPDAAALDIVGDIDLRCRVALDDWTPALDPAFVSKFGPPGDRSYLLTMSGNGKINMSWTEDGTATKLAFSDSNVLTDGEIKWVRATLDVDDGASGNAVKHYLSDDGSDWTQLGSTVTTAGVTSIYSGAQTVEVGANSSGGQRKLVGKVFRAEIYDGIDGTRVFDARFEDEEPGTTSFQEVSHEVAVITINQSGDPQAEIVSNILDTLLVVADALHAHSADTSALIQASVLAVLDALHGHSADHLALVFAVAVLRGKYALEHAEAVAALQAAEAAGYSDEHAEAVAALEAAGV